MRRDGDAAVTWGGEDYVAQFTAEVGLVADDSCLVVVDMQNATGTREGGLGRLLASEGRLQEAEYRFSRIEEVAVPNSARLLQFCRGRGIRRVFLTYGSEVSDYSDLSPQMRRLCEATNNRAGTHDHEIVDALRPLHDERVFNKLTPSAFSSTPIELVLRSYGIGTLLFAGISTNMCVEHTLRDASDRGFRCVLVEDACAADSERMHQATLEVVPRLYGVVSSTAEVIARLEAGGNEERAGVTAGAPVGARGLGSTARRPDSGTETV